MKGIYLLTFHCAYNVGAMLQCYSLCDYIRSLGCNISVIDYRPKEISHPQINTCYGKISKYKFNNIIKRQIIFLYRMLKYGFSTTNRYLVSSVPSTAQSYALFMKKMQLTQRVYHTYSELVSDFADSICTFVVGSDQVWNTSLIDDYRPYFLEFTQSDNKYSYAASCGSSKNVSLNEGILSSLKLFRGISVREDELSVKLKVIGIDSITVLDPVFLKSKEEWTNLVKKDKIHQDYIFVYRTELNNRINGKILELKEQNPSIKVLKFDLLEEDSIEFDYKPAITGPIEFLTYIYHSKYVVTNSFHGAAFSIIFNKSGYIFKHSKYGERINSLLGLAGVRSENSVFTISGNEVSQLLPSVKKSKSYIKRIVRNN